MEMELQTATEWLLFCIYCDSVIAVIFLMDLRKQENLECKKITQVFYKYPHFTNLRCQSATQDAIALAEPW